MKAKSQAQQVNRSSLEKFAIIFLMSIRFLKRLWTQDPIRKHNSRFRFILSS
jgi:hypothetical protein